MPRHSIPFSPFARYAYRAAGMYYLSPVSQAHIKSGDEYQAMLTDISWMVGPNWPGNGEIDIIEGVNDNAQNQMTLHTSPGCTVSVGPGGQTGTSIGDPSTTPSPAYLASGYTDTFQTVAMAADTTAAPSSTTWAQATARASTPPEVASTRRNGRAASSRSGTSRTTPCRPIFGARTQTLTTGGRRPPTLAAASSTRSSETSRSSLTTPSAAAGRAPSGRSRRVLSRTPHASTLLPANPRFTALRTGL